MKLKLLIAHAIFAYFFSIALHAQTYVYVAADGSDTNSGTEAAPLQTLEGAQIKVRSLGPQTGGTVIYVRGGNYSVTNTLKLTSKDSGTPLSPITWSAYPGEDVIFDGGTSISTDGYTIANDPNILHANGVGNIYVKEITDGTMQNKLSNTSTQLAFDGIMMTSARFPNKGFALINKSTVSGEVTNADGSYGDPKGPTFKLYETADFAKWANEKARINKCTGKGYMSADWFKEEIAIASIDTVGYIRFTDGTKYGLGQTHINRVSIRHMLCELDEPGEWYYDNNTNLFYMWPYENSITESMSLSYWGGDEVFNLSSVEYVSIKNFTIQNLGGQLNGEGAISIGGYSKNCQIAGLTFRNINYPMTAVNITGSATNCGVLSSDFIDVDNASRLYGGNASSSEIKHGHNYIENCHFTQIYAKEFSGKVCGMLGAGNFFRNNLLHNCNIQPITHGGVDHVFELNEIFNVGIEEGDGGAIYTGADWASFGNVIQHNFVHHIMSVPGLLGRAAFFSDDGDAGETVKGNVLFKGGWEAIKMNGGAGHTIVDNLLLDCQTGIRCGRESTSQYSQKIAYFSNGTVTNYVKDNHIGKMLKVAGETGWEDGLTESNWNLRLSEFWQNRYPTMKRMIDAYAEKNCIGPYEIEYINNCFWSNTTNTYGGSGFVKVAGSQDIDLSIFNDPEALDFSYKSGVATGKPVIPFKSIGLYVDQYRSQVPDKDTYRTAIKSNFLNKPCHTSDSYDYRTINDRLYYNTGEIVYSAIPSSGATAPIMRFLAPTYGQSYLTGADIDVSVDATDEGSITSVSLYINDTLISTKTATPYMWNGSVDVSKLDNMSIGSYVIKVVATDNDGNESNIWNRVSVADSVIEIETVNVALGKTVSQSSDNYDGVERGSAQNAVDGFVEGLVNLDSSWTHTTNESEAWLEVDLEDKYRIYDIQLWNRINGANRLRDFYLLVSDYPFESTKLSDNLNDPRVTAIHHSSECERPTVFDINGTGRYIRVQLVGADFLTISELQVRTLVGEDIPVTNVAPKAFISNDRVIYEGDTIVLNSSESSDFEDSTLFYEWMFPEGTVIFNINSPSPSFVAQEVSHETNFPVSLTVSDGMFNSLPFEKIFKIYPNNEPVIVFQDNVTLLEKQSVILDASDSYDPESKNLEFVWSLPTEFSIVDSTTSMISIIAPVVTETTSYSCMLTISDGVYSTSKAFIVNVSYNQPPVANAGPDQSVMKDEYITFTGLASSDAENSPLSYSWIGLDGLDILSPNDVYPYAMSPQLPVKTNKFLVSLVVNDGFKDSEPDTVAITIPDLEIINALNEEVISDLNVYPNPVVKGQLAFVCSGSSERLIMSIYDITGRIVTTTFISELVSIETNLLTTGQYFVQIQTREGACLAVSKLIVR